MQPICDALKAHIPEILQEWRHITDEEPWSSLPEGHRLDNLPQVAIGLFEASICDPADAQLHAEKVEAAVRHGEQRRAHGLPETVLLSEYYLLREAIWRYLKRNFPAADAGEAVLRIDNSIMLATRATLLGYHRQELEAQGRWPSPVETLVRESPLLQKARRGELGPVG